MILQSLCWAYIQRRYVHPSVHGSPVYQAKTYMEATYMSIGRWMDKEDVVHIYNGILAIKNILNSLSAKISEKPMLIFVVFSDFH